MIYINVIGGLIDCVLDENGNGVEYVTIDRDAQDGECAFCRAEEGLVDSDICTECNMHYDADIREWIKLQGEQ